MRRGGGVDRQLEVGTLSERFGGELDGALIEQRDEAVLLARRNEDRGRQQPSGSISQAQQPLMEGDVARPRIHHRLEGERQAAQRMIEPLKEYGAILLEHQPEFVIDRVSLTMPEGTARISGRVALPGFVRADLEAKPAFDAIAGAFAHAPQRKAG